MNKVKCPSGEFEAIYKDESYKFLGIPYATYKDRWDESRLLSKEINFQAFKYGSSSPQTRFDDDNNSGYSFFLDNSLESESEDCLTLNICTKSFDSSFPVMIWIHGGALVSGGSSSMMYELEHLAKKNIVLVSINYRLGPLGFLKLDEVTNGSIMSSGNEGLIDQRNAIKWVKKNIASFGGDPENITIFGESAGSWSCNLQVAAGNQGLFRKAICQSGGMDALASTDKANRWAELFVNQFKKDGFKEDELLTCRYQDIITSAKKLRHSQLSDGKKWIFPEVGFLPVIDNKFIKDDYLQTFAKSDIDYIAGSTLDEYKLWSTFHPKIGRNDKDYILRRLSKMFLSEKLPEIISLYQSFLESSNMKDIYSAILTDICFGIPTHKNLQLKKSRSFGYLFAEQSEILNGKLGCFHASELPYVFGVHSKKPYIKWGPKSSDDISRNFQQSWISFAANSDPSFGDFKWSTYNSLKLTLIGKNLKTITNPFLERYELIEKSKIF